jgi:hypothetical protein
MSETADLTSAILLAVPRFGARLFRNNIGQWEYAPGKFVRYGVCNPGGGDLIGWTAVGRFFSVEIKKPGRDTTPLKRRIAQQSFRDAVNGAGGLAIVARSVEDVISRLKAGTD